MLRNRTVFIAFALFPALMCVALACTAGSVAYPNASIAKNSSTAVNQTAVVNPMPVVHVFVALADNEHQGIVPVSASLGNGDNPKTNLYWGAAFGVKTFFLKSKDWEVISETKDPAPRILDRIIFKKKDRDVFIVADAYQGKEIAQATWDFLEAASGAPGAEVN